MLNGRMKINKLALIASLLTPGPFESGFIPHLHPRVLWVLGQIIQYLHIREE